MCPDTVNRMIQRTVETMKKPILERASPPMKKRKGTSLEL
jgi:hypothetical protein